MSKILTNAAVLYIKDEMIKVLRGYFYNKENYIPMLTSIDYSDVKITDKTPKSIRDFPLIVLGAVNGRMIHSGLGDYAEEVNGIIENTYTGEKTEGVVALRYGGMYEFNFVIEIGTRNLIDTEELTDIVALSLRWVLRRHLQELGIIIKDLGFGQQTEVNYDSDKIYATQLNVTVWSEWYQDLDLLTLQNINLEIKDK